VNVIEFLNLVPRLLLENPDELEQIWLRIKKAIVMAIVPLQTIIRPVDEVIAFTIVIIIHVRNVPRRHNREPLTLEVLPELFPFFVLP
jgi:hypothetical protein